jgi:hypothetical protein
MTWTLPWSLHGWRRTLAERRRPAARPGGTAEAIWLPKGATWSVRVRTDTPLALTCEAGLLWLTREGDASDYVLGPGERLRLEVAGHVVVQALRLACFRVS